MTCNTLPTIYVPGRFWTQQSSKMALPLLHQIYENGGQSSWSLQTAEEFSGGYIYYTQIKTCVLSLKEQTQRQQSKGVS